MFQLLRRAHPPQTPPCARNRALGPDASPGNFPNLDSGQLSLATPLILPLLIHVIEDQGY